jgi:hypothetical protein
MNNEREKSNELIRSGADLAGAAVGGAIGFLAGGPGTAALAGALGVVITKCLANIAGKVLTSRERTRIGTTAAFAISRIKERIDCGNVPRQDAFFSEPNSWLSDGEQIFEGVLLKARDEYEEKKLEFMGYFFANLAFSENISAQAASHLLKQFERLTYRQLCILALLSEKGTFNVECLRRNSHENPELEVLKREEMDLHSSDLGTFGLVQGVGSWHDKLSTLGQALVQLAQLDKVSTADIEALEALLNECSKAPVKFE